MSQRNGDFPGFPPGRTPWTSASPTPSQRLSKCPSPSPRDSHQVMTSASLRSSAAGLPNGRAGTWSHLRPKLFALCPASSWCSNMFFWIKLHQDISLLLPTPLRTNTIAFKVKSLKIERERSAGTQCLPRTGLMRATENVPLTPHHQANKYQGGNIEPQLQGLKVWLWAGKTIIPGVFGHPEQSLARHMIISICKSSSR